MTCLEIWENMRKNLKYAFPADSSSPTGGAFEMTEQIGFLV